MVSAAAARGRGPWATAVRRLGRDRTAMLSLLLLALIVLSAVAAPLYAHDIAHTNPFGTNIEGSTIVHGKRVPVIQQGGGRLKLGEIPIGPTWDIHHYFLGADSLGRDVMARVLYGGQASLLIGVGSAVLCTIMALIVGLLSGFFGGVVDSVLTQFMDILWAFPVYLLAIALATVTLTQGLRIGILNVNPASLWVPTLIIAVIYVPYVARPIRGDVLSVRRKEFVEAAIAEGASDWWLIVREVLPNVITTAIVLLPLMISTNILTESALSFLSIGVQPPQASWGTIVSDGQDLLYSRPWISLAPGIMIMLTVLSLNFFGDGVRDALDPRARLRVDR